MKTALTFFRNIALLCALAYAVPAAAQCQASFTYAVSGGTVTFTNTSTANIFASYSWNFGDNTGAWYTANPSHSYNAAGTYNVCMYLSDSLSMCADTFCTSVTVSVGCNNITAAVSPTNLSSCSACDGGATANVTGGTGPFTYVWSNATTTSSLTNLCAGSYSVTVADANGCTSSASTTLTCPPSCNAGFTYTVSGGSIIFTNTSTSTGWPLYTWNFGDNTGATGTNAIHSYNSAGTYYVCLYMSDSLSTCTSSFCDSVTVSIGCNGFNVGALATNTSSYFLCDGAVNATVSGGSTPYAYLWSNSGTTSSVNNVCPGYYSVDVTDANGCVGTAGAYVGYPNCSVYFTLMQDTVNPTQWYAYTQTLGGPFTYLWDFGDNTTSTLQYPTHTYAVSGHYDICVTVTDTTGCSATYCDTSSVHRMQAGMQSFTVIDPNTNTTGIATQEQLNGKTWPNPVSDMLNVSFNTNVNGNLYITDLTGKVVVAQKINGLEAQLDMSTLPAGIYNVSLSSETMKWNKKVVIVR